MVKGAGSKYNICTNSTPRVEGGKRHYSNQSYIETEGRVGLRQAGGIEFRLWGMVTMVSSAGDVAGRPRSGQ